MPHSAKVIRDWLLVAAAVLFIGYILFSPTGSFVRAPGGVETQASGNDVPLFFSNASAGLSDSANRDRVE